MAEKTIAVHCFVDTSDLLHHHYKSSCRLVRLMKFKTVLATCYIPYFDWTPGYLGLAKLSLKGYEKLPKVVML